MKATRMKPVVPGKTKCDRCQTLQPEVHECSFTFRDTFAHWKQVWQSRAGHRLTRRQMATWNSREGGGPEGVQDLKDLSAVGYWLDLCDKCWEECRDAPCPGYPGEFYYGVLQHAANNASGDPLVPKKTLP